MNNEKEQIKAAKVYKLEQTEQPIEQQKEVKEEVVQKLPEEPKIEPVKVKKPKNIITNLLLILLILVGLIAIYQKFTYDKTLTRIRGYYTPVSTLGKEKELDLNSTIVKDLYNKVKTNIREDVLNNELNDEMRLYLTYRNMPHDKFYESNCSGFNNAVMAPFTCSDKTFKPNAFKAESLEIEYKKLFGEFREFNHDNIQLGSNCIGGYQYIESRKEYVQGTCTSQLTTSYRASKKLISAISLNSTIILKEEVKYTKSEGQKLPESLKSGTYIYEFRLDNNYNYIYTNKYLEEE